MTKEKIKRIVQRTIQNHWFYAVCVCVVILFLGFQIYNLHLGALFIQDDCKDMDDTVLLTATAPKRQIVIKCRHRIINIGNPASTCRYGFPVKGCRDGDSYPIDRTGGNCRVAGQIG